MTHDELDFKNCEFTHDKNTKGLSMQKIQRIFSVMDNKEQIIQDFKELILKIDNFTENEINNSLLDITKRVRKLYKYDRDDRSYQ